MIFVWGFFFFLAWADFSTIICGQNQWTALFWSLVKAADEVIISPQTLFY